MHPHERRPDMTTRFPEELETSQQRDTIQSRQMTNFAPAVQMRSDDAFVSIAEHAVSTARTSSESEAC